MGTSVLMWKGMNAEQRENGTSCLLCVLLILLDNVLMLLFCFSLGFFSCPRIVQDKVLEVEKEFSALIRSVTLLCLL